MLLKFVASVNFQCEVLNPKFKYLISSPLLYCLQKFVGSSIESCTNIFYLSK